ncbi:putative penicillin-binding protein [Gordonia effusa NBRC 100432]|uniref:Putative penicillin-binding protein n=1 Tax=Gordonia effusa NBRC 100432 TaxID=1077974 RepID=H0QUW1_9ACTN|nr:serine hydrolase [Gordonia effusa]GAB16612.1 putative penicillin-binding protein [Gordonia effusa NBRC 100432]
MNHVCNRGRGSIFATLVAATLLLSACGSGSDSASSDFSVGSTPPPAVAGIPADSTRIDDAVSQVPDLARKLLERSGVPGLAVAVVRDGKTVYVGGFGVKDIRRQDDSVNADTVFQIASVSKAVSATVVAGQVGSRGIEWSMPIVNGIAGFTLTDPYVSAHVTLADMFSHRSGLPDHAGDNLEDVGYSRDQVLERLRYLSLAPFRTQELYTNFGVTAAATAVANKAGESWEDLSAHTLFGPVGMSSTSARYSDFLTRSNRATLHAKVDGKFQPLYQRDADAQAPAGGVSSNVKDLAKWMTLLLAGGKYEGKQAIPEEALLEAMTPQLALQSGQTDFRPAATGFGFNISSEPSGRSILSHSGAFASGAATNFVLVPSLNIGIVVLTNGAPVGVPETLTKEFTDLAQYGRITTDWLTEYAKIMPSSEPEGELVGRTPPPNATPARPLDTYAGVYANNYFGPLTVISNGTTLKMSIGPKNQTFALTHFDGDTFTFEPSGENANHGSVSQVRFAYAGDRARSVWVEFWDQDRQGTFTRR